MPTSSRPPRKLVPAPLVRDFRGLLDVALSAQDEQGRVWADARWGVYAFFDYDGEPVYVGQTNEQLRTRVRRHLTNQRTDAVAMRILDVFEVAELQLWPLWHLQAPDSSASEASKQQLLNSLEYTVYLDAIAASRFGAILNEVIPPVSPRVTPPPSARFTLISDETRSERGHADVRIARRSETISRLAAVAHERGLVSDGLRRVLVIQAVRLAYLSASRLAFVEGRPPPDPSAIDVTALVGTVLAETAQPETMPGETTLADQPPELG